MSDSKDFKETAKTKVLSEAQKEAFDVEEFVAWAEKDPRVQDFLRSIENGEGIPVDKAKIHSGNIGG